MTLWTIREVDGGALLFREATDRRVPEGQVVVLVRTATGEYLAIQAIVSLTRNEFDLVKRDPAPLANKLKRVAQQAVDATAATIAPSEDAEAQECLVAV